MLHFNQLRIISCLLTGMAAGPGVRALAGWGGLVERGKRVPLQPNSQGHYDKRLSFIITAINTKRMLQGTGTQFEVLFLFRFGFQACMYHSIT